VAAKNPNFCHFWDLAFSDVAIKIVSVLQRLHGENGRTISDVQKRDGQTERQKISTLLATPVAGEIRAPPNMAR